MDVCCWVQRDLGLQIVGLFLLGGCKLSEFFERSDEDDKGREELCFWFSKAM